MSSLVSDGGGVAAMRPLDWRRLRMTGRVREGAPALVAAVALALIIIEGHGASWFHLDMKNRIVLLGENFGESGTNTIGGMYNIISYHTYGTQN